MADPAAVIGYRCGDVVAVDVEVVQVGEQPHVGHPVFVVHPIDDTDRISGGEDRIPWCAADGFDEHCRADTVPRLCGVGQVLGGDVILFRRCVLVDAVAVQRVERACP